MPKRKLAKKKYYIYYKKPNARYFIPTTFSYTNIIDAYEKYRHLAHHSTRWEFEIRLERVKEK